MISGPTDKFFRTALLLLALLMPALEICAQNIITGKVTDADGSPVAGAFIYAYSGNGMAGYSLCDEQGEFRLKMPEGKDADTLRANCLGFKAGTLSTAGLEPPYEIRLEKQPISIKEARVTASAVEEKGDTLKYMPGAFSDGTEKVLSDLLEKIPGLAVTESGGLKHNGTFINKFYVEGMDLMGSRYGVVTKNLDPDKIAAIEIYRHHQPIRVLSGIANDDRSAVNIILKESARGTWLLTGDALLGAPELPLFDARVMLTRFAKESQDLLLLKGNNVGTDIIKEITEQQYFGKTGAFRISQENLDSDFESRLNPVRTNMPLPREYWYDNISGIGSVNHLKKISDEKQLRYSLQAAAERCDESSSSTEEVTFDDGNTLAIREAKAQTDTKYYLCGKISYENNAVKGYVKNDLTFSGQLRGDSGDLTQGSHRHMQQYTLPSFKVQNDFDATLRRTERKALKIASATRFVSNSHEGVFERDGVSYDQIFNQKEFISNNSVSSIAAAGRVRLDISGGLNLEYQGIDATLDGTGSSVSLFGIAPNIAVSATAHIGKTELRAYLPAYLHIVCGGKTFLYPEVSPSINLERKFSQSFKARAHASYSISRSRIESLLPCTVMSGYRSVSRSDSLARHDNLRGEAALEFADNPAMFYATLSASAYRFVGNRMPFSLYSDITTATGYTEGRQSTGCAGVSGKVSKFFGVRTFVIELSGGWSRLNEEHTLQDKLCSYSTDMWDARAKVRTNPTRWISIEAIADWHRNDISGSSANSSDAVALTGSLSLIPLKQFSVTAFCHSLHESAAGIKMTNTPLLKCSAEWKFQKFAVTLECRNILDCKEFNRTCTDTFRTFTTSVALPGRQYLAGIRMSL